MAELRPELLSNLPTLVVEDNKFMRNILGDLLRQVGFSKLYFAADGKEAIGQIKTWLPSLVFTDWNMPEMNGLELIRWIRRSGEAPNAEIPIILITGNNQQQEIMAARDSGVNEFIAKPVTISAIQQRLISCFVEPRKFVYSATYCGPCRRRRRNVDYKGPLRRLDDPMQIAQKSDEQMAMLKMIRSDVDDLTELTRTLDVADRRQVREVRLRTDRARALAVEAQDEELGTAAASLISYVDAVGATGLLDREVVWMHLTSMNRLMELGDGADALRAQVVEGLRKVVAKRLRQAAQNNVKCG